MNKTIVITGAGGVLCSAFARDLAKTGAPVALLDRNLEAAEAVAAEIRAAGGNARAYETDVLDKAALEKTHEAVLRDLGLCRVLLNGAGGNNPRATTDHEIFEPGDELASDMKTFFNLAPEGFDFVFRLNLMGTLLPTQVFAKDMLGQEGCCVLNISSMNAYRPLTKIPAYSGAKAAVSNFTQRTGKILAATPMKRFGEPEELLGAVRWLIDPEAASFVTGVVIPIDGGFSAYSGV